MRHRSTALPLVTLAVLALAPAVLAGGWAQVTVTNLPADPPAGEPTTIELDVLQHGATPVSWPGLTVVATDPTSGTVIRTVAEATGPVGSYVATLVFPNAGDWALTFESTDLIMEGSVEIRIAPAIAAGSGAPGEARAGSAIDVMPVVLALFAIGAALVLGGLALRGRRPAPEAPVSART